MFENDLSLCNIFAIIINIEGFRKYPTILENILEMWERKCLSQIIEDSQRYREDVRKYHVPPLYPSIINIIASNQIQSICAIMKLY